MKTFIYENILNENMIVQITSYNATQAGWILETWVMHPNDFELINKNHEL